MTFYQIKIKITMSNADKTGKFKKNQRNTVFRPVGNKSTLVRQVVDEIEKMIMDGQLTPNTKLPPERELSDKLGVSRTVMREAIHILVTKGLIDSKQGVGTVVRELTTDNVADSFRLILEAESGGISFEHLHQVRAILEIENAGTAAQQATDDDIAHLRQIMIDLEAAKDDKELFVAKDTEFHRALAYTTQNPLLAILLDSVRNLLQEYQRVIPYVFLGAEVLPHHNRIVERVAARDAEGARQAMRAHLDQVHDRHVQAFGTDNITSSFSTRHLSFSRND
jgi:GntR family transcriptional repressor for pyruvate dehydrogenase complex